MRLARMVGIEAPHVEIRWLGDAPYFLIERYDRVRDIDGVTKRLHQEDFCQALGIVPEIKYEREGGPNVAQCLDLLQQCSVTPAADRLRFLQRLIFSYIVGNADAHGKNYGLLYKSNIPTLAPAYDILCTAVYPELSTKMAMKIGKRYEPNEVFLRHWYRIVPDTAAARGSLEKELNTISKDCLEKAENLKYTLAKEGVESPLFDQILAIIRRNISYIERV